MPRGKKKSAGRAAKDRTHDYIDDGTHDESEDEDLPSDEAGRRKIKKNYEELLGIRIDKLREMFDLIEPGLIRYPAIDPASFRAAVAEFCQTETHNHDTR